MLTIDDLLATLQSDQSIASGEVLPRQFARKIWSLVVTAEAEGFEKGFEVARKSMWCLVRGYQMEEKTVNFCEGALTEAFLRELEKMKV